MRTTTANLDKQVLTKMNQIAQDVIDGKLSNPQAAEKLRKLREALRKKRAEANAKARSSQLQ